MKDFLFMFQYRANVTVFCSFSILERTVVMWWQRYKAKWFDYAYFTNNILENMITELYEINTQEHRAKYKEIWGRSYNELYK